MQLSIQEDMLYGKTTMARFQRAKALGLQGIEIWANGISARIEELAQAIDSTGIGISAINLSQQDGYLSPHLTERENAISRMRQALATSIDLQASRVVFTPHNQLTSAMPDLTPYRSAHEIESEMMIWLLRTVSDLAYALGAVLYIQPAHRYQTNFMNTLAQAGYYCDIIKDHPHIRIAPHTLYMAHEESDFYANLQAQIHRVSYLHIGDSNHGLPTQGLIDWAQLATVLKDASYDGWATISAGTIGANQHQAADFDRQLPDVLQALQQAGFSTQR